MLSHSFYIKVMSLEEYNIVRDINNHIFKTRTHKPRDFHFRLIADDISHSYGNIVDDVRMACVSRVIC